MGKDDSPKRADINLPTVLHCFSTEFGGCFDDTDSQEAALRQLACEAAAKSQRRGMDGGKEEEAALFLDYKVSAPPVKTAVAAKASGALRKTATVLLPDSPKV